MEQATQGRSRHPRIMNEGYRPSGQRGYQPQSDRPLNPLKLTPPTGGSSVQPPTNGSTPHKPTSAGPQK